MRAKKIMLSVLTGALLLLPACAGKVDTTKDFAMTLNGQKYVVKLDAPAARIQELEAGYSNEQSLSVTFPIKTANPMKVMGFRLAFKERQIVVDEEIESHAGDDRHFLHMQYFPLLGHKVNEGTILTYSSRRKTGSLRVRFDELEAQAGGRVKGIILYAALYAYYQKQDSPDPIEPKEEKKLEIYNFPFEATFVESTF
ncbi:MAG: hypothetical protein KAW12_29265 [Candidatus Aminicenantes bacterium]|nr:hypothetical protein [Candidatus Aminicenantes bacterium]